MDDTMTTRNLIGQRRRKKFLKDFAECDRIEFVTVNHRKMRRIDGGGFFKNDRCTGTVSNDLRTVLNELRKTRQAEYYQGETIDGVGHVTDTYYPMVCDHCGIFVPLDENGYCEACECGCELCENRFSDDLMETEHVCRRCAEGATR